MANIAARPWSDAEGEEDARLYTLLFPAFRNTHAERYGPEGPRLQRTLMVVAFEPDGRPFVALDRGLQFPFAGAGFQVDCATEEEVDRHWGALCEGGEEGPAARRRTAAGSRGRSCRRGSRS